MSYLLLAPFDHRQDHPVEVQDAPAQDVEPFLLLPAQLGKDKFLPGKREWRGMSPPPPRHPRFPASGSRHSLHGPVDAVLDAHEEPRGCHLVAQVVAGVRGEAEVAVHQGDQGERIPGAWKHHILEGGREEAQQHHQHPKATMKEHQTQRGTLRAASSEEWGYREAGEGAPAGMGSSWNGNSAWIQGSSSL